MSAKTTSLKARINNYAKRSHIPAQVVMQNYMQERFLERLSKSKYQDKFVIKGGALISALVGLDTRSTMDLDATLRKLSLSEAQIRKAVEDICKTDIDDGVSFQVNSIAPIRKDDVYGGYRVKLNARFETIITPLSIDVSTGDVITPDAVKYEMIGILDETIQITLWGYNIETVLAEKVETILSRGVFNTRPRDYYDVYILSLRKKYDRDVFQSALRATAEHRNSTQMIKDTTTILQQIEVSEALLNMWIKYQETFYYAKDITYVDTIAAMRKLLE